MIRLVGIFRDFYMETFSLFERFVYNVYFQVKRDEVRFVKTGVLS